MPWVRYTPEEYRRRYGAFLRVGRPTFQQAFGQAFGRPTQLLPWVREARLWTEEERKLRAQELKEEAAWLKWLGEQEKRLALERALGMAVRGPQPAQPARRVGEIQRFVGPAPAPALGPPTPIMGPPTPPVTRADILAQFLRAAPGQEGVAMFEAFFPPPPTPAEQALVAKRWAEVAEKADWRRYLNTMSEILERATAAEAQRPEIPAPYYTNLASTLNMSLSEASTAALAGDTTAFAFIREATQRFAPQLLRALRTTIETRPEPDRMTLFSAITNAHLQGVAAMGRSPLGNQEEAELFALLVRELKRVEPVRLPRFIVGVLPGFRPREAELLYRNFLLNQLTLLTNALEHTRAPDEVEKVLEDLRNALPDYTYNTETRRWEVRPR